MKHNVGKLVWIPYSLVQFFSVWEEASEDIYIHTHRHIGKSEAIVPPDGHFHYHDRVLHVSPATTGSHLGSLPCIVATELLVLRSEVF
jgi:hypothetical protein